MKGKTHIAGGIAAGAFYLTAGGSVPQEALFFASCAAGALMPDIDHKGSTIGRKIPLLDNVVSALFGHRAFTHSLLFLFLAFLLFTKTPWAEAVEFGIWLGMASHLVLDMITVKGIKLFWPIKLDIGFPKGIKTGSALEEGFLSVLIVFIGYCGYRLFFK
ncbi:metal-dependent hydrolase [Peribacillus glennii]|uniref:Metal-dependent hydrolase n=1 Tax=Peribacillus glennii TaxID=2303991 RepID=A0A372LHT7_9BACI|nr:metal-dependent hydrolase [Peribacillus glennii]RFU65176.1 metal-dependent hydrolase [Peribacillus glennii]